MSRNIKGQLDVMQTQMEIAGRPHMNVTLKADGPMLVRMHDPKTSIYNKNVMQLVVSIDAHNSGASTALANIPILESQESPRPLYGGNPEADCLMSMFRTFKTHELQSILPEDDYNSSSQQTIRIEHDVSIPTVYVCLPYRSTYDSKKIYYFEAEFSIVYMPDPGERRNGSIPHDLTSIPASKLSFELIPESKHEQ
jgi:hypothetical protein